MTGTEVSDVPGIPDILAAARRLSGVVRKTPLEHSMALSAQAGMEVHLKLENLQRTGSFKFRGACNAMGSLPGALRQRGVVTASAGNHGLGVALAARLHGVAATIFVPVSAPRTKRERIGRFGATLREIEGTYDDAHAEAERYAAETGAPYVHAFSDPAVVAGQGTVGLEILQELPNVQTLLVPVGGGGLIGGVGRVARALNPAIRVIGVQSSATPAMHASLAAGRVVSPPMGPTLCDGLAGDIDSRSLCLAQEVVDRMMLIDEDAVTDAIRWLYMEEGLVCEGSGATVIAALREGLLRDEGTPVAAVVSGGNIDAPVLAKVLAGTDESSIG